MRRAELADLDLLVALEAVCARNPWSRASLEPSVAGRSVWLWQDVAYCVEQVVVDQAEILTCGVSPAHRRRRVGHQFLDQVSRTWWERGVTEAWLEVREGNMAARRLYVGLGWRETGRRDDYYGPGEHALCMSLQP